MMEATFVVNYELTDQGDTGGHYQRWHGSELKEWSRGRHPAPDLVVRRSRDIDELDFTGGDPERVAAESGLLVGGAEVDLLGSRGRVDKDLDGWSIDQDLSVRIMVPDTPFGPAAPVLRWLGSGLTVDLDDRDETVLTIAMSYEQALEWIWDDLVLGELLFRRVEIAATDVFALSALEGLVSAPHLTDPPRVDDVLRRFRATRERLAALHPIEQYHAVQGGT